LKKLNLDDIAKRSGVSKSTVSRVVNDHPNVSKKVRSRVLKVIHQTGYQPHAAARALVSNRSMICGLILPRTVDSFFTDPYFPALIQSIARSCGDRDYTLSLFLIGGEDNEDRIFQRVARRGFLDGVFVQSGNVADHLIEKIVSINMPLVVLGRPHETDGVNFVDINNVDAVESAITYLAETGHKRIATVAGPFVTTVGIDRRKGYIQGLEKNGLPVDENLIYEGDFLEISGYEGGLELAKQHPDAIFVASDKMALGVIRALKDKGLSVPEDVSVIGFDDFPVQPPAEPFLTSIRQPLMEFGDKAIEVLLDSIDNGGEVHQEYLPTEFIIRGSTRVRNKA
jgi:LacI family transcriptional regulator